MCLWFGVCVIGVCQVEWERPRCGGRSCDGGRRAALEVADDIGVRVRLYGVMGCVGLVVCNDGALRWGRLVVVLWARAEGLECGEVDGGADVGACRQA